MAAEPALVGLTVANAVHLGFQATVTLVVYPALAAVEQAGWPAAHERHSRRITPLVIVTYAALLATTTWALVTVGPQPWVLVSALGAAGAIVVTAVSAGPTHARLAVGRRPELVVRLLRVDRFRLVGAVIGLAGSLAALLSN